MKQVGKICTALLVSSLMLSFGTAVLAEEMSARPDAAGYEEPLVIDREATIEELVRQWGTDEQTAYQLRATLEYASDEKLTEAWDAESLDEINGILRGKALEGPLTLDDTDEDYVFTPVTPCRIVDTRNAGGMMTANSRREFYVYGSGTTMLAQGGNGAGCTSPVGEPLGVHVNITAVEQISSGGGHLRAFPANVSPPTASILNFMNGQNAIANAASVKTFYSLVWRELEIFASANTHVIIDVLGYYSRPEKTALNNITVNAVRTVTPGALYNFTSPTCPAGYTLTGGGCNLSHDSDVHVDSRPNAFTGTATRWTCIGRNTQAYNVTATAIAVCSRVPGR